MDAFACCMDPESRAALRVSKDIEREIERWKRDNSKEYKLLLLGKRAREWRGTHAVQPQNDPKQWPLWFNGISSFLSSLHTPKALMAYIHKHLFPIRIVLLSKHHLNDKHLPHYNMCALVSCPSLHPPQVPVKLGRVLL